MLEHVEALKEACGEAFAKLDGRFTREQLPPHLFDQLDKLVGELQELARDADACAEAMVSVNKVD